MKSRITAQRKFRDYGNKFSDAKLIKRWYEMIQETSSFVDLPGSARCHVYEVPDMLKSICLGAGIPLTHSSSYRPRVSVEIYSLR
ncbi:hypothetical protein TNCV_1641231 [Trichonephila clavipes]|nr:hypothetical protein TNCV_1641231 [Trichonephila clavipes]